MIRFKDKTSFEERKKSSARLRAKHGNDVYPVVVEPANEKTPPISKNKFLVPGDFTVGQFVYIVRRKLVDTLSPTQALFVYVRISILPSTSATIEQIFEEHHEADGILYIEYSLENTFG